MRVAVLQSNYIPWKGYFDIIQCVDMFIFYDDVQFTKNDWRNRNRIKTQAGVKWLTIPCGTDLKRLVCEVQLKDDRWQEKHWKSLQQSYSRCLHFADCKDFLEQFYMKKSWQFLSELNQYLIRQVASSVLGIPTVFRSSTEFTLSGRKGDRLVDLLTQVGADIYVSGPSARGYIDPHAFQEAGIEVQYMDYGGYPEYPQVYPPFVHEVTILDVLFHVGSNAPKYIWGWRDAPAS